jgi:hypothetical protein
MTQMDYADAAPEHPDQERAWIEKRNLRAKLIRRHWECYITAIARPLCQTYAAKKFGTRIVWVNGPTTQQCARCGERTSPPRDRSELIWTCSCCGTQWDQDVNAARNLLAAAAGAPTDAELVQVAG